MSPDSDGGGGGEGSGWPFRRPPFNIIDIRIWRIKQIIPFMQPSLSFFVLLWWSSLGLCVGGWVSLVESLQKIRFTGTSLIAFQAVATAKERVKGGLQHNAGRAMI